MKTDKTKSAQPARNSKEKILRAAYTVFSEKGYKAATIPEIASLAGYSVGNIYRHFENKKTLFIEVVRNYYFTDEFISIFQDAAKYEFEEFLETALLGRLYMDPSSLRNLMSLFGEFMRDENLRKQYREEIMLPITKTVEDYLRKSVASGKCKKINPEITARAIMGMVIGMTLLNLMEGEKSPVKKLPKEEVASAISGIIKNGII